MDVAKKIVLFKSVSERNESVLDHSLKNETAEKQVMGTRQIRYASAIRGAEVSYYRQLGVATGVFDDTELESLKADDAVAGVFENELRRLPPDEEEESVMMLTPSLPALSEVKNLAAYLMGMRDLANNLLSSIGGDLSGSQMSAQVAPSSRLAWHLPMVGVDENTPGSGEGVTVAVLDTGIDLDHPDFTGRFIEGDNAVSFIAGESVNDLNGHGTHCCGLVGGPRTSVSGQRYGVAPNVNLLAGKVLSNGGSGYDDGIIDGIDWAVESGAQIISMSLSSSRRQGEPYSALYERIASNYYQVNPSVLFVAAAGNDSARPHYRSVVNNPAAAPSLMAIAAVDQREMVARSSCAAFDGIAELDVSAPGVKVFSSYKNGGFISISGTSMATPIVSGIAALYMEREPNLNAQDVRNALKNNAKQLGDTSDFGSGLVQL